MKAFVLAAGRGERMMPLTRNTPKPLLSVGDKTLLDYQLQKLIDAGVSEVIINVSYLGEQVEAHVAKYQNIKVRVSREPYPLETAGAIYHARSMLGDDPFLLVNGDVWIDLDYRELIQRASRNVGLGLGLGYLVFVPNPEHKLSGDFELADGVVKKASGSGRGQHDTVTFSGVSILSPLLVENYPRVREVFPLREVFEWGIDSQTLKGEQYDGYWLDVGTPERLQALHDHLA